MAFYVVVRLCENRCDARTVCICSIPYNVVARMLVIEGESVAVRGRSSTGVRAVRARALLLGGLMCEGSRAAQRGEVDCTVILRGGLAEDEKFYEEED
jgi:hypothetical protein